jgi:hypothetical protein
MLLIADRQRQRLAVSVGTRQATQLPSLARADAGDEKRSDAYDVSLLPASATPA